jgi:RNA polymerase sigma factor (TIGR02999 family)
MNDITNILSRIDSGDPSASEQLLPLVYDELRRLATQRLAQEKPGQTLQATALVHEAYLRLVDGNHSLRWNGRGHFFGAAAEAMRRILVERARQKLGPKRGGHLKRQDLDAAADVAEQKAGEILAIDEALTALASESPIKPLFRWDVSPGRGGISGNFASHRRSVLGLCESLPIRST